MTNAELKQLEELLKKAIIVGQGEILENIDTEVLDDFVEMITEDIDDDCSDSDIDLGDIDDDDEFDDMEDDEWDTSG